MAKAQLVSGDLYSMLEMKRELFGRGWDFGYGEKNKDSRKVLDMAQRLEWTLQNTRKRTIIS